MVKIRLKRMGSKLNAFYRIVVSDSRVARNGKSIEQIGFYNPHSKEIRLEEELKNKWLENGAKPTITVKKLFKRYETSKKSGNLKNDLVILKSKIRKKKNKESVSKEQK